MSGCMHGLDRCFFCCLLQKKKSEGGQAALLAWLATHRLRHLRLACMRPQELVRPEELAAVAARMPRLESLEAPAAVLCSHAWAAASTQLTFLSLTTPTHVCGVYLWYLPPQLGQLAGLHALRLGAAAAAAWEST